MKKYITWMVVPLLVATLVLPTGAQAYYTTNTASNQQQIAYLYTLLAQLQAQLNALIAQGGGVSATNVFVQTDGVSVVDNNYIEMNGRVNFTQSGDARVWFEYGQTTALNYSTESQTISSRNRNGSVSFSLLAPDLRSNTMYYYRSVAEGSDGRYAEGAIKSFTFTGSNRSGSSNSNSNYNNDTPEISSLGVSSVQNRSAVLTGTVDMNDYDNGYVFFVYGTDESDVADAGNESRYSDIRTNNDYLRKIVVDSNLDNRDSFRKSVTSLNSDMRYYFSLCVEYDEDGDATLECSDVEDFRTDY